jgi:hypothetical protein
MITAQVLKGVHELLLEHGVEPKQDEELGDFVARGLHIDARQANILLTALHDGAPIDQALAAAEIDPKIAGESNLLSDLARLVGGAAGRLVSESRRTRS